MTMPEAILPDFPDVDTVRTLRFHLHSLLHDLAASIAGLKACLPLPAMTPAAMWRIRDTVADVTSSIEHDAQHHVPSALALLSGAADNRNPSAAAIEPAELPQLAVAAGAVPDDSRHQLAEQLGVALAALARAQVTVVEACAIRGSDAERVRRPLQTLAEVLWFVAWPAASRSLALAKVLHRATDPAAAAAEDRAEELATPLREVLLVGARVLETCPRCGAPLTAADRTFDGSYCENCRSRYVG